MTRVVYSLCENTNGNDISPDTSGGNSQRRIFLMTQSARSASPVVFATMYGPLLGLGFSF